MKTDKTSMDLVRSRIHTPHLEANTACRWALYRLRADMLAGKAHPATSLLDATVDELVQHYGYGWVETR